MSFRKTNLAYTLLLSASAILLSITFASALNDEPPAKTEGTANPKPLPALEEEKAILANIKAPDGMVTKLFAREPDVQDPTAITFDDQNRLYIAETHRFERGIEDNRRNPWVADDYKLTSTAERLEMLKEYAEKFPDKKPMEYFTKYSEMIRVIEDRDDDGKCDHATIYADGFNNPLDGTAAGVMALDGKIYFACIPHVWLLEDTNGDLKADKRESLQEGYGISVSLSGHDLNGFALGPDNRIWFTIGDRGYNLKTKEGKHLYSQYEGAVFRMERDGSNLEVVHTGLRNPKEIAFDRFGNAFSVDNEADMQDMARCVDVVEGAHSGWQRGHQAFQKFTNLIQGTSRHDTNWMRERHWDMDSPLRPRAILPPAGWVSKGPSGLAYNPGTGLSEKWDNHFFVCDFVGAGSAVIGFRMEPNGAGFKIANKENFVSGMLCTDIEFGYDSKAYVTDYVGSWPTHGFGNIFSFEDPAETAKPETKQVRELFANGIEKLSVEKLADLLRHPDMRVRLRSQIALAGNPANRQIFVTATNEKEEITTRLHGVWGLGNLARLKNDRASADALIYLCGDADAKVRGQAIQCLGDLKFNSPLNIALSLLNDSDPRTRMLAAIAVGKLGHKGQVPALMALVEKNNDQDEYVRHGAVQGMVRLGKADAIYSFANSKSPAVRRAVVLAFRRMQDARIGDFLKDSDLSIAVETVQAINDNYIEGARPALAEATHLIGKSTWAVDLRILNALIRTGGDENIRRLLTIAADESLSENARTEAMFLVRRFEKVPPTDPTTGMYRPIPEPRNIEAVVPEIRKTLESLLTKSSGNLLVEVIGAAGQFNVHVPIDAMFGQLNGKGIRPVIRLAALKMLEKEAPDKLSKQLVELTADPDPRIRAATLESLGRLAPETAFEVVTKILTSGKPDDQQRAYALLTKLEHPKAAGTLLERMKKLSAQPGAVQLDILNAAAKRPEPEFKASIADYEASLDKANPLAAFHIAIEGGNVDNGQKIFHGSGNCVQCHKAGARPGGEAGPNLNGIAARENGQYILESIVEPNAKLTPGYSPIAITMNDGSLVSGLMMKETDTEVVVKNIETKKETICKKSDIKTLPPAMSTMPPMGLILSKSDIRDLIAFLQTLNK
jgi:quinoprotein glucose dehydrogenase